MPHPHGRLPSDLCRGPQGAGQANGGNEILHGSANQLVCLREAKQTGKPRVTRHNGTLGGGGETREESDQRREESDQRREESDQRREESGQRREESGQRREGRGQRREESGQRKEGRDQRREEEVIISTKYKFYKLVPHTNTCVYTDSKRGGGGGGGISW